MTAALRNRPLLRWLPLLILVLAAALRLTGLTHNAFWYDEIWTMKTLYPEHSMGHIIRETMADIGAPMYYLLLRVWMDVLGHSDLTARLFSALCSLGGVWMLYRAAREVASPGVALLTMWMGAVTYGAVYYAHEVRFYGLLFLLASSTYWLYFRLYRQFTWGRWAGLVVLGTAAFYTHYHSVFFLSGLGIWSAVGAVVDRRPGLRRTHLLAAAALVLSVVLFLPWMLAVASQLRNGGTGWLWLPQWDDLVYAWPRFGGYDIRFGGRDYFAALTWFGGWAVALFLLLGGRHLLRPLRLEVLANGDSHDADWPHPVFRKWHVIVLAGFLVAYGTLMPYALSYVVVPMFLFRYLMGVFPLVVLLASIGIWSCWRPLALAVVLIFTGSCAYSLFVHWRYYEVPSKITADNWRGIAADLSTRRDSLPVYADIPWAANYYFRQTGQGDRAVDMADASFPSCTAGPARFWFLTAGPEFAGFFRKDAYARMTACYAPTDSIVSTHTKAYLYVRQPIQP